MRTLEQIIDKLYEIKDEYQDYGYGEIHDEIYYQIKGALEYDMDEALIKQLDELTEQLESHLYYITNTPEFNWIFG